MNTARVLSQSLLFHWRIHAAVALGVAAAAAVLTGALLVGDSVRGSLRHLTLDRLGQIDELLIADHFFRQELAAELASQPQFDQHYAAAVPAILFPSGTIELAHESGRRRASGVTVIGSTAAFWQLGDRRFSATKQPGEGQIVLNAPLAEELGAKLGDTIVLRLGKANQVPADSPLGRKTDRIASIAELQVSEIIPAESLGRFSLQPTQTTPHNAYVSLGTLQTGLEVDGKANAIFVARQSGSTASAAGDKPALAEMLRPRIEDYGLTL
ncbi:MAG: ABC transporter permease, partial [Pirellulaceae bacterium]